MKTIVNIVSTESPAPAYLFVKEKYVPGDRLMFIATSQSFSEMKQLERVMGVQSQQVEEVVLEESNEAFSYERICRRLRAVLRDDVHYWVNLAGGTRYMALAVQQAFSKCHTDFFYVNIKDNTIVKSIYDDSIYDDDDYVYPIHRKMKVAEYLNLHGILHDVAEKDKHLPIRDENYVHQLFDMYVNNLLGDRDFEILEILRMNYRNSVREGQRLRLDDMEQGRVYHCPAIHDLSDFLAYIGFVPSQKGFLSKEELDFLTGGWFEEHCYYLAKRRFAPDDIYIGVHIARTGVDHDNELDVVFTKDNVLHVVEAKSGISSNKLFNEIVYKACALKEALLGMMCHYYVFSLKRDSARDDFRKIAAIMGVDFWGKEEMLQNS